MADLTETARNALQAQRETDWLSDEPVHVSRMAAPVVAADTARALRGVRQHRDKVFTDYMVHHGDADADALVTRRFDNCDGIWLMTELESYRLFGQHEVKRSKRGRTIGDGIAKAAGELGCAASIIAVLALVGFIFYMIATHPVP